MRHGNGSLINSTELPLNALFRTHAGVTQVFLFFFIALSVFLVVFLVLPISAASSLGGIYFVLKVSLAVPEATQNKVETAG